MGDTDGRYFWDNNPLNKVLFGFILLLQFSIANSQCNAVIGSNPTNLEGCEVFTIQFSDLSTGVVSRSWDFGDGTETSNAQNPVHSFSAGTGDTTYTVKLTISCASGTSIAEKTVTVYAEPKVSYTSDAITVCAITDSICFDNHSDYHPSNRYSWNFGDGTISDELEPCKVYSTPGKYAPTLTVINQHDCLSSFTMSDSILVEPVPSTAFSVSEFEGCVPFTVSFDNITDTAGNSYSEWTWQYDDGSPDYLGFSSDPHTYTSTGEYTVRLAATNTLGCSNYSTQIITVKPSPVSNFMTSAPECLNDFTTVEFTGTYLTAPVFDWDFNGATTVIGSGEGPYNVKWDEAGNKDISLAVDDNGCTSLYSEKIQVTPIAKVYLYISASEDTICSGETITFTTSPENFMVYSFYLNSTVVQSSSSNTWESSSFNDGDKVYVNITDANGCSEIISDTVTINVKETPVVTLAHDISTDTVCVDEPVEFTASPSGYDDYTFMLNNNEILQPGTNNLYTSTQLEDEDRVNVIATHNGCASELSNTKTLTIKDALPPPDVNCGTASPNSIMFAWDSVPGALEYEISIDNGAFQTASSGSLGLYHEMTGLAENDAHSIRIRALDSYLCGTESEIISGEVTCTATNCTAIEFDLDNKYRSVCENDDILLTIDNISIDDYTVSWDGVASGKNKEYSLLAANNIEIPVNVANNEEPSCPSVTKTYVIEVTPKVPLTLSAPSNEICGNSSVDFTILPQGLDNYQLYDNGDLLESDVFNSYSVSNVKNEHFYFASAVDHACVLFSDTIQMLVTDPLEIPAITFESSTESSVTFSWDPVPGATGYLVSRNDGDFTFPSSGQTGLFHTINSMNPGEAVSLTAIAIGDGICGDSEVSLPAYGYAETCDTILFDITKSHRICLGDSVQLKITNLTIDDYDIYWGGLPAGRQKSLWMKPNADTLVRVTVKNRNQPFCAGATKYVSISVANPPQPLLLSSSDADNIVCQNDQVLFTVTPGGYDNYTFYEYSNLLQAGAFNTLTIIAEKEQYNIRAKAINRGCEGEFSNNIITEVLEPLNQPQVNCGNSSENTLSFVWDSIPEALEYEISIDGQPYMTASSGAGGVIHELSGLNAGDSATINVVALGAADCTTSIPSEQVTCYARDCDIITYTIDPYHEVCENEIITLELSDINIPDYSVSWNNGAYSANTSSVLEASNDTTVTVNLRDNDQPNCPVIEKAFQIDVINLVPVTLNSNATNDQVCQGNELELTVSPNHFERYVFLHGADTLQDDLLNTFTTSYFPDGFDVQAHVYQNNCLSSTNVITTETLIPAQLNLTASASGDFCKNDLVEFTASSGFDQYTFMSEGDILEESEENSINIPLRDKAITVSAIDENNCLSISADTIKFNLLELPVVTISSSTDTICFGEFASYNAFPDGLDNFTFFRNNTPIQSSTSNYYSTDSIRIGDIVSVVGTDENGCRSKKISSEYPYIIPYPDYTIGASADGLCLGDTLELYLETAGKDPKYAFYWNTGETTDTITVHPSHTTSYSLLYSDGRCNNIRIDNKTIFVDREEPPIAYAGEDTTVCIYDSIQLQAEGGQTALWSPDSGLNNPESYTPFASPTETTIYVVTVTNTYCKDSDSVMVIVDLCLEGLTNPVPQIITPNSDGINDYWEIEHIDYFETNSLKIFNRWGNEVYSASPYLNEWYGQSKKGIDLPDGTYFYILTLGNGTSDITGYVIIHR